MTRLPLRVCALFVAFMALFPMAASASLPPVDSWVLQSPVRAKTPIYNIAVGTDGAVWAAGRVPLRSAYPGGSWEPISGLSENCVVGVGGSSTIVMARGVYDPSQWLDVSNDGGATWQVVDTGVLMTPLDCVFASAAEGWLVGSSGIVLHTTDGGLTWTRQDSGLTGWIRSAEFANGALRVVSDDILATSMDFGQTWTKVNVPGARELTDLTFTSIDLGYVVGAMGVARTNDGGATWTTQPVSNDMESARVVFKDALNGWIHGCGSEEYATTNGGLTWERQYTANEYKDRYGASIQKPYIKDGVWPRGSSVGWRIDGTGGAYFSVNGGKTWYSTAISSFTLDDLTDVSFESTYTGYAVTRQGRIFKSTDSGGTWSLCTREYPVTAGSSMRLESVVKVAGGRGFAAGADTYRSPGVIYRTSSSGSTWYQLNPPVKGLVRDVWTNDGVTVWAAGEYGSIVRSVDDGDHWTVVGATAAASAELWSIKVLPNGFGMAVGNNCILRTRDGGRTWNSLATPRTTTFSALEISDSNVAWVGTTSDEVFRTNDGGDTWVLQANMPAPGEEEVVTGIVSVSPSETIVSRSQQVAATTDSGETWRTLDLGPISTLNAVAVYRDSAWVCGDNGYMHYNAQGHPEYLPPATRLGVPTGWIRQSIDLNLFAFDADGIDETLYRLDATNTALPSLGASGNVVSIASNTWSKYTKPRRVTKQGKTKVEYLSRDRKGNVERRKTRYVTIDSVKPTLYFTAKSSYKRGSKVTVKTSDAVSGVKKIIIGVSTADAGYWKTYRSSKAVYTFSRRGRWMLDITITDNAGNQRRYYKTVKVY